MTLAQLSARIAAAALLAGLAACAGAGGPAEEGQQTNLARETSDFFRRLGTPPDEYKFKIEPPPRGPLTTGRNEY